jgi:nicotinate-nucleotide adenylyltransferase
MEKLDRDEQFIEIIRGRLTPKRFAHSLAVADEATRLAGRFGADMKKAHTAGLLHDILKDTDGEGQLQILHNFGILLDNVEQHAPKLWHAHAGAVFIEKVLGVEDQDLISAVRYHTTARAGMSMLEKVLYLADFTSADRDYSDVEEMRRLVDVGVEQAMEFALTFSIKELVMKRQAVHPDTMNAYNEWAIHNLVK